MSAKVSKWILIIGFTVVFLVTLFVSEMDDDKSTAEATTHFFSIPSDLFELTTTRNSPDTTPTEPVTTRPRPAEDATMQRTTAPEVRPQERPIDERIPRFVQSEAPNYKTVKVQWVSPNIGKKLIQTVRIDRYAYEYYRALPRYKAFSDYQNYLDDEYNRSIVSNLADSFRTFGREQGYTDEQIILEAIAFVQAIPYERDIDSTGQEEFQKYPLETLFDCEGDCEDSSFLLAGFLRELGCKVCLLDLPEHIAVGIQDSGSYAGRYYEYQGFRYFYVESTNTGWDIGEMPEDYIEMGADLLLID